MTIPPIAPPNRRRRRIVVTIVVFVLGLGWWFWPRVDQRFVGSWNTESRRSTRTLRADGTGTITAPNGNEYPLRWWLRNGRLTLHYTSEGALQTLFEELHELGCTIRGTEPRGQIDRKQVVGISETRITFDDGVWLRASGDD
jgi:hypothetical protein